MQDGGAACYICKIDISVYGERNIRLNNIDYMNKNAFDHGFCWFCGWGKGKMEGLGRNV